LSHDLYVTVFEYVEATAKGGTVDIVGLIESIDAYGFAHGLRVAFRLDEAELERRWGTYLSRRYGGSFDQFSCE
jgi:hypothetical protein